MGTHMFETISLSTLRVRRRDLVRGAAVGGGALAIGMGRHLVVAQDSSPVATPTTDGSAIISTITAAATAFLATLSADEQGAVLFDWSDTEQKQRWSNFPDGAFQRAGLMWGDLGDETQAAWLALMQATLSARGYQRIREEWAADDAMAAENSGGNGGRGGGGANFGSDYYWIALIGTPSETDPWQWQFGGHHVTVNATVAGTNVALTPSFIGSQPVTYTDEAGTEVTPLGDIEAAAFALINALDAEQQSAAILGDTYIDLVLGPGADGKVLQPEGLAASQLTSDQRTMLEDLIGLYTGLLNDDLAPARLAEVTDVLDDTYLAWYGPTTQGSPAYFRVSGPTIVIEYSPQGDASEATNHVHGIYRDPSNDYGVRYAQ